MNKFEFNGEQYKKASTHQKEWGNKILAEIKLTGNESVLDLGCGAGVLTEKLALLVPAGKVLGIDSSKGMIEEAKKLKRTNLNFIIQNINEITYQNKFDFIFSNATLHWIKDHQKLLNNCYTALKATGFIRFNFAGDDNCSNFFAVVKETMKKPEFQKFFVSFVWPWYMPAEKEYQKLVGASHFNRIKVWAENADRYFSDTEQMIAWIDQPSLVPFLQNINDNKTKQEFRNTVVGKMIAKTKQTDGRCFETFRRINVFAQK